MRGKVFDTLCVLVSRSGRLIGKDDLMAAVWPDTVVEENNLAHNINALRKALGEDVLIETVPGKGYRFAGTACLVAPAAAWRTVESPPDTPKLLEREQQMQSLHEAFAGAVPKSSRFSLAVRPHGSHRCRGWRAVRNSLNCRCEISESRATACSASSPNWPKS
jgi:DNA-binding winged helix-turn-helix (wHTH) protein